MVCPKSTRIVGFASASRWRFLWIPCIGLAALLWILISPENAYAAFVTHNPPNTPLGQGHGIFPGRVVWIYDPAAVSWEGAGNWYDDAYNNQTAIDGMVSQAVRCISGQTTDAAAWDALFHSFNRRTARGDVGYTRGEKIAIKINENNVSGHANNNNINASPHMVLAVLRQLIKHAGVAESAITVFDASRFITDNVFDKCHAEFPGVVFVDHEGGDGRVKATFVTNAIPGSVPSTNQKDLATCDMEAKYIIDMALLKGHVAMGVTLCAKNFFGVTAIETDWHKNGSRHHGFDQKRDGSPSYMAFVDYLGHPDLGGKTLLYMIDGLYGSPRVETAPASKWKMAPFNNRQCGSLFVSEDGVAIDSVGIDFLISEFPNMPDLPYCDNYLQEAAQANDPPSHTVYKPDGIHVITNSLGVAEHWNNPNDKKYSRNLSPSGTGIELIAIQPEPNISEGWKGYHGKPFQDSVYQGGPQMIPGRVHCAYYDLGGEGVAYHDSDPTNHGSGALNPANGEYLNEFRMQEGVDISYTKFKRQTPIDDNPYDLVTPPSNQLYVGWTEPGEWFNLTVNVKHAGRYAVDFLYTSNRGGTISLDRNGEPLTQPITIVSTKNDQDPVGWRQWHHWNVLRDAAEVDLPKGISVLTVHILTQGNMNLAYFDFRYK